MNVGSDLLRGNTDTIILALINEKDSYGYEINTTIYELSCGLLELKEATLYTAFKRLENQKLINGYWGDESGGGRRKYYRITDKGRVRLKELIEEWDNCKKVIDTIIGRTK